MLQEDRRLVLLFFIRIGFRVSAQMISALSIEHGLTTGFSRIYRRSITWVWLIMPERDESGDHAESEEDDRHEGSSDSLH